MRHGKPALRRLVKTTRRILRSSVHEWSCDFCALSSDQQREASIEDQVRLCKERADREGLHVAGAYTDHAISGASMMRPGIQQLLQDALAGKFENVLAEAMDRLSRDQADMAGIYKRLRFAGVIMASLATCILASKAR